MKKNYLFKLLVFAVIAAFVTVTSCKDYDDDINRLNTELSSIKTDYAAKIDAAKAQITETVNTELAKLNAEIASLKTKVDAAATKADIEAAKTEILGKVVAIEVFNAFKTSTEADLTKIKADLLKAATKEELDAAKAALTTEIGVVKNQADALGLRVTKLEEDYVALLAQHEADIADVINKIAALKAELAPKITALEAAMEAAEGRLDQHDIDLVDQLALINKNKDDIADLAQELKDKYEELVEADGELQTQITTNTTDIGNLKTSVDAIEKDLPIIKKSITDLDNKLGGRILSAYQSLDHRVTGLTFIPDFTSPDGTAQLLVSYLGEWYKPNANLQSWSHKTPGTSYKGITYAKYHVSPSNATLADFEVVGLLQKTTEVILKSGETPLLEALVDEVTLENGILTVPVLVSADNYTAAQQDDSKNVSVALQIKNKNIQDEALADNEERLVVSSQYVRTDLNLLYAQVDTEEGNVGSDLYPTTLPANVHLAAYPADVLLWNGYNQVKGSFDPSVKINLNDYVQAVAEFNSVWRLLEEWGYEGIESNFVFELVDGINEGVDQSNRYVVLDGATGIITVAPNTVTEGAANQAAVGRTPVVLAKVLKDGKVYAAGYIKIVITDNFNNSAITDIPTIVLDPFTLNCSAEYVFTDGNKLRADMDQIFNHERVKLGKDAFFNEYTGTIAHTISSFVPAIAGNVANAADFEFVYGTYPDTQSGQMENYIKGTVVNTAPAGKYTIQTTLSSQGYRPDIILTWTIEVKLPEYSLTANTAILKNGKFVVNPTIFEQGAKTSTAYEGKLNNAFMHNAGNYVFTPLPEECAEFLTPYFVFTGAGLPAGYTVSADKTKIMKGTEVAAEIVNDDPDYPEIFYVRLNNDNLDHAGESWHNFTPLSEASKGLVGKTVKVQPRGYINGVSNNWINLYVAFDVEFVKPLKLVLPEDAAVYDQANKGLNVYTFNPYDPTTAIVDWNGAEVNITTADGRALIQHYEVGAQPVPGTAVITDWVRVTLTQLFPAPPGTVSRPGHNGWWFAPVTTPTTTYHSPFAFDVDNARCNIQVDGSIGGNIDRPLPAGLKFKTGVVDVAGYETVIVGEDNVSVPTTYAFEWENASTGAIQDEFKVAIPVTVKHKWGVLSSSLVITVKVGSGNE